LGEQFDLKWVIVRGLQLRGIGRVAQGDAGGLEDLAEGVRMGVEWGLVAQSGPSYVNWADWTAIFGEPAASLRIYQEGIEYSKKHGASRQMTWAKAETTWRLFDLGRWDDVIEVADEIARWEEQHGGQAQPGVISGIEKMHVLAYRGRNEEAARLEEELLPRAKEIGDPQVLWQAMMVAAVVRLARGDHSGARDQMEELLRGTEGVPMRNFWIVPEGLRVLIAVGDPESVRGLVEEDEVPVPTLLMKQMVVRAALAEAEGDLGGAVEGYREVAEAWKRGGFVFEHANALLASGRSLLPLGRAAEASQELSSAREIYLGLGAEPLLRECDELLGEATALTS
jgi:hypothetical protein